MFDGNIETCWNSESGSSQFIIIDFKSDVIIRNFRVMFQGGFVGSHSAVQGLNAKGDVLYDEDFFPEDNNALQKFTLESAKFIKSVKILFKKSTDFYGRITVYCLDLYGAGE